MEIELPDGWSDETPHPEDGVEAWNKLYLDGEEDIEVCIWTGIEGPVQGYGQTSEDDFIVEYTDGTELIDQKVYGNYLDAVRHALDCVKDAEGIQELNPGDVVQW